MKRLWLGVIFLLLLLIAGIWQTIALSEIHGSLSENFSAAASAAAEHNWEKADAFAEKACVQWGKHRRISAAFTDHEPLEQMESLISELQTCAKFSLREDFALICIRLSQIAQAIGESFQLTWWSIL